MKNVKHFKWIISVLKREINIILNLIYFLILKYKFNKKKI